MAGSYQTTFNGVTIFPSGVTYNYLIVSQPQPYPLQWPLDNNTLLNSATFGGSFLYANVMDINCTNAGASVQLPNTLLGSVGSTTIINNVGTAPLTIQSFIGGAVCVIAPAQIWVIYYGAFTGGWTATQLGSLTTTANAAVLAGAGLKALGTSINQVITVVSTALSGYTFGIGDLAKLYVWMGGVGTWNLPSSVTIGSSYYIQLKNGGNGALTVAPNGTDLINTANSGLVLNPGDSCFLVTDGAGNWWTIGLGNASAFRFNFQLLNMAGLSGTYTLGVTGGTLNQIYYRFTGALSGNLTFVVPTSIQQYWIDNETTGGFQVTIGTSGQVSPPIIVSGQKAIYAVDGVNVTIADSSGIAIPVPVNAGGTGATTAGGALINLGGGAAGIQVFQATTIPAVQAILNSTDASTALAEVLGLG